MATDRLTIDGYGVLELNRVSFPITGRVVADLPLSADFTNLAPAENGMILAVDYAKGEIDLPTGATDARVLALHYSPEKEYDPNLSGLNRFKLVANATNPYQGSAQGFYPRLGILSVGDRFTTNCISYDPTDFTDEAGAIAALAAYADTAVYATPSADGSLLLDTAIAANVLVALQVVGITTLPNGDFGVQFVVVKAQ